MPIELKVPEVGESITEVQIGEWLKREGEHVEKDENLVELETDKATVELPSPVSDTVAKVLKRNGDTATVGEVIGYIEEGATPEIDEEEAQAKAAAQKQAAQTIQTAPKHKGGRPAETHEPPRPTAPKRPPAKEAAETAEKALVVAPDVPRPTEKRDDGAASPNRKLSASGGAARGAREEEAVPMSPIRRRIAQRLVEAQQTAALLTTFNEVDMSEVVALRNQHKDVFLEKFGIKLGFMSFFIKAAIDALKLVPQVNAEIRGNDIVYHNYFDIGIAVGGGKGLVVPVLRDADRMSFAEIELAIADLAHRARDNSLTLDELQGGTFTISNGGVYGSLLSTPIVNPPQSGILGLHAIQDRPVARNGQVVIRPMMYIALTYDHRIVDGQGAVTFLKRVKEVIEEPMRMLVEV